MNTEDHSTRREKLAGWDVNIVTYRIGEAFYCHVDNVSPGATVARGQGKTAEEAEKSAIGKATDRLAQTRTQ